MSNKKQFTPAQLVALSEFAKKSESEITWVNAQGVSFKLSEIKDEYLANLIDWTFIKVQQGQARTPYLNRTYREWHHIFNTTRKGRIAKHEAQIRYNALIKKLEDVVVETNRRAQLIDDYQEIVDDYNKRIVGLSNSLLSTASHNMKLVLEADELKNTWGF